MTVTAKMPRGATMEGTLCRPWKFLNEELLNHIPLSERRRVVVRATLRAFGCWCTWLALIAAYLIMTVAIVLADLVGLRGLGRLATVMMAALIGMNVFLCGLGCAGRRQLRLQLRCMGYCPECGYDLRATPERCPECGKVPGSG